MKTTDLEHDQAQLAPLLSETLRKHRRGRIGCSWYVDETFRYCWPTRFLEFVKLLGASDRKVRKIVTIGDLAIASSGSFPELGAEDVHRHNYSPCCLVH